MRFYSESLQFSSFLAMTYFGLRDCNILPEKELHSSLWVAWMWVLYGTCWWLQAWGLVNHIFESLNSDSSDFRNTVTTSCGIGVPKIL